MTEAPRTQGQLCAQVCQEEPSYLNPHGRVWQKWGHRQEAPERSREEGRGRGRGREREGRDDTRGGEDGRRQRAGIGGELGWRG